MVFWSRPGAAKAEAGVVADAALQELVDQGLAGAETLVWQVGWQGWRLLPEAIASQQLPTEIVLPELSGSETLCQASHRRLWQQHGDAISSQYAGSAALRKETAEVQPYTGQPQAPDQCVHPPRSLVLPLSKGLGKSVAMQHPVLVDT